MSARLAAVRRHERSTRHNGHLRLVRRKRRSRKLIKRSPTRRLAPLAIIGSIAIAATIFAVLLEQVVLAQSAFDLTSVRERMARAEARHEELLLEAARLDSSARIERYAREALGMVNPEPANVQYIVADVRVPARGRERPAPGDAERVATQTGFASGYNGD
jgi:cell division protein FtsL